MKDYLKARNDCDKAIELNPSYGFAYLNRGIAKEMLRDNTACNDWQKAADLGVASAKQYYQDCK